MLRSGAFQRSTPLHTEAAGAAPFDAFGPFRVLHQIGTGMLGQVFRAYDPDQDRRADAATVLPLAALTREGDNAAVWVIDPKTSRVQRRPVRVGQYREDGATILSGVTAGDIVVAAGAHKLRADQQVRLQREPGAQKR